MFTQLLAIFIGGGLGALARYSISVWCLFWFGERLPYGTFFVNTLGSFLIGVIFVCLTHLEVRAEWRGFLMVGLLGAFTTFSAFSIEATMMLQGGRWKEAISYMIASVLACILMTIAGIALTRKFFPGETGL